jgi:hypothetical protein
MKEIPGDSHGNSAAEGKVVLGESDQPLVRDGDTVGIGAKQRRSL